MGDEAGAWELLTRARALHPEAPEVRAALGAWLVAAGRPEAALAHFEAALASPKWQPALRLMRARLLLETGAPLDLALAELGRAEREAEISPERMAECARLLGHPAFGALSPLLGATGQKTIAVWERVLAMTGNAHREALLEVRMLPLKQFLAGGPRPEPRMLEDLLVLSGALLEADPSNLLARYYEAELLESLRQNEQALRSWTLLLNGVRGSGVPARLEAVINRAVRARARLDEQGGGG
jgi:tetratricopeptide (TPR) repeat protein